VEGNKCADKDICHNMGTQSENKAPHTKELAKVYTLQQDEENRPHNPLEQIHQPHHQIAKKASQYFVPTKNRTCASS
jgi:hypothetical protein